MIGLVGDMNPGPKLPPCNLGRSFNREQTLRTMTLNTSTLEMLFIFERTAFCVAISQLLTPTRIILLDPLIPRTARNDTKDSFGGEHDWEKRKHYFRKLRRFYANQRIGMGGIPRSRQADAAGQHLGCFRNIPPCP